MGVTRTVLHSRLQALTTPTKPLMVPKLMVPKLMV